MLAIPQTSPLASYLEHKAEIDLAIRQVLEVSLPMYPQMTDEQAHRVCEKVVQWSTESVTSG